MAAALRGELQELTEDERRALRASRFGGLSAAAPIERKEARFRQSGGSRATKATAGLPGTRNLGEEEDKKPIAPRLAHPGGALTTNKAAALARFLKRKLEAEDGGAGSSSQLDPQLVDMAVRNAQASLSRTATAAGAPVRHVATFDSSPHTAKGAAIWDELSTDEEQEGGTNQQDPKKRKKVHESMKHKKQKEKKKNKNKKKKRKGRIGE